MLEITAPFQTMKSIQEFSAPALLVNSAHRDISLEDFGKSATITAKPIKQAKGNPLYPQNEIREAFVRWPFTPNNSNASTTVVNKSISLQWGYCSLPPTGR